MNDPIGEAITSGSHKRSRRVGIVPAAVSALFSLGAIRAWLLVAITVLGLTSLGVLTVRALGHCPTWLQDLAMTLVWVLVLRRTQKSTV